MHFSSYARYISVARKGNGVIHVVMGFVLLDVVLFVKIISTFLFLFAKARNSLFVHLLQAVNGIVVG